MFLYHSNAFQLCRDQIALGDVMVDSDVHDELIKTKEDSAKIERVGMLIDWIFKTGWILPGLCLDKMVGDEMIPVYQI